MQFDPLKSYAVSVDVTISLKFKGVEVTRIIQVSEEQAKKEAFCNVGEFLQRSIYNAFSVNFLDALMELNRGKPE